MQGSMEKPGSPGALAIAAAYVSTVVGAGFASGQEILQFFTGFGRAGLIGLAVSPALFALFGVRVLELGRVFQARSHRPVVYHAAGPWGAPLLDGLLTLFLLATAAVMAAGAGATVGEQYGWTPWIGSGLLMAGTVGTVLGGIHGVLRAGGFGAPVLLACIVGVAWPTVGSSSGMAEALAWAGDLRFTPVPFWFLAAPLYVAYNLVLSVPVLTPLGAAAGGSGALRWGGILGGIALGLGATLVHFAVAGHLPEAGRLDIPMLYAARALPGWVPFVYSLVLLVQIYTTAVGALFGFAGRVAEGKPERFRAAVIGGGAAAFLGGQLGFAHVVGATYPLMGVAGIVLMMGAFRRPARPSAR